MIKKILTALFSLSSIIGVLMILGTAGSADLCLIGFETTLSRCAIGLVSILMSVIGFKFIIPAIHIEE